MNYLFRELFQGHESIALILGWKQKPHPLPTQSCQKWAFLGATGGSQLPSAVFHVPQGSLVSVLQPRGQPGKEPLPFSPETASSSVKERERALTQSLLLSLQT